MQNSRRLSTATEEYEKIVTFVKRILNADPLKRHYFPLGLAGCMLLHQTYIKSAQIFNQISQRLISFKKNKQKKKTSTSMQHALYLS